MAGTIVSTTISVSTPFAGVQISFGVSTFDGINHNVTSISGVVVEGAFDEVAPCRGASRSRRDRAGWLWWDVGPGLSVAHGLPQGIRIVALVRQQHGAFREIGDQPFRAGDVALFAGSELELDWATLAVDERVDLGGEVASGATQTAISTPLLAVAPC